ncbi:MAG: transposase [Chloroflexi bacterium]|nr:transposase [Chloroflexota bacterium]
MSWRPSRLTKEQLEERRLAGARMLRDGLRQAEIARELGVSEAAVSQWKHELAQNGTEALRAIPATGRPCKLDTRQRLELKRVLQQGPRAAGFDAEQWTQPMVRQLVQRRFGVWYHPNYVGRLLAQLGMLGDELPAADSLPAPMTMPEPVHGFAPAS